MSPRRRTTDFRPLVPQAVLLWACCIGCSSSTPALFTSSSDAGATGTGDGSRAGAASRNDSDGGAGGSSGLRTDPSEAPSNPAGTAAASAAGFASAAGEAGGASTSGAGGVAGISGLAGGTGPGPAGEAAGASGSGLDNDGRCTADCCATTLASDAERVMLADSVRGFSGTQGRCGWSFGYLPEGAEPFTLLTTFISDGASAWTASTTRPPWFSITSAEQHPNQLPLGWIDRRWTSATSGPIIIQGHVAKADGGATGDGVRASIQVGGTEIWSKSLAASDTHGHDFSAGCRRRSGHPG